MALDEVCQRPEANGDMYLVAAGDGTDGVATPSRVPPTFGEGQRSSDDKAQEGQSAEVMLARGSVSGSVSGAAWKGGDASTGMRSAPLAR